MPFTAPEDPRPVRLKLYVAALELNQSQANITLRAVTRGEDNKEWAAYTPWGELKFGVKEGLAADNFAPGQEWLCTLTPIPPAEVGQEGMGAAG